jgi:hypothetical protein
VVGTRIPEVTPAPVASAAIVTAVAAIIMAVAIVMGAAPMVGAIITAAVEGITLAGSIREVSSLDIRQGPIIPNNISSRGNRSEPMNIRLLGHRGLVRRALWEVNYRRCPARRFNAWY